MRAQYSHTLAMETTAGKKILQYFLLITASHHVLSDNYSPKIVGGFNVTTFQGFKHQVSIRDASHESSRFGSGHLCGGSLIDYDTVSRRKRESVLWSCERKSFFLRGGYVIKWILIISHWGFVEYIFWGYSMKIHPLRRK